MGAGSGYHRISHMLLSTIAFCNSTEKQVGLASAALRGAGYADGWRRLHAASKSLVP